MNAGDDKQVTLALCAQPRQHRDFITFIQDLIVPLPLALLGVEDSAEQTVRLR